MQLRHSKGRTMTKRNQIQGAMVVGGLVIGATVASAAILNTSGDVIQFTPASVVLGDQESDTDIIAFDEKQCFTLGAALDTDQGKIPAETKVSCHLIHSDAVVSFALLQGRVLFDNQILGVISTSGELDDSDPVCDDGVLYPTELALVEANRGLEPGVQVDQYQIIAGGFGIAVRMEIPASSFSDQVRVITECE
jgi:hypothetical protein